MAFVEQPTNLFPTLVEGVAVDDDLISGVPVQQLELADDGDVDIRIEGQDAAFRSAVGVYIIAADGAIGSVQILTGDARAGDVQATLEDLPAGSKLGFFVVANSFAANGDLASGGGSFAFKTAGGGAGNVNANAPLQLVHIDASGAETRVEGSIYHTYDANAGDDVNRLNPENGIQAISGLDPATGELVIGFEDRRQVRADQDYNDVVIRVSAGDDTPSPDLQTDTATTAVPATGEDLSLTTTTEIQTSDDSVAVSGFVNIGGAVNPPFNIAFVIDHSGSMGASFGGSVGDLNGDGLANTRLDGAIAAFQALNQSIIDEGLAGVTQIQLIAFDDTAQSLGTFSAGAGLDAALASLDLGGGTSYEAPLQEAIAYFQSTGTGSNFVFFASDGQPSESIPRYADEVATLTGTYDADIRAIGIGDTLTGYKPYLDAVDSDGDAELTSDPESLTAALGASVIDPSDIDHVDILVDGAVAQTLQSADLSDTAFGLSYSAVVSGLDATDGVASLIEVRAVATDPDATVVETDLFVRDTGMANRFALPSSAGGDVLDLRVFQLGDSIDIGALLADPAVSDIGTFVATAADLDSDGAVDDVLITVDAIVGGTDDIIDVVRLIDPAGIAGATLASSGDILTFA